MWIVSIFGSSQLPQHGYNCSAVVGVVAEAWLPKALLSSLNPRVGQGMTVLVQDHKQNYTPKEKEPQN